MSDADSWVQLSTGTSREGLLAFLAARGLATHARKIIDETDAESVDDLKLIDAAMLEKVINVVGLKVVSAKKLHLAIAESRGESIAPGMPREARAKMCAVIGVIKNKSTGLVMGLKEPTVGWSMLMQNLACSIVTCHEDGDRNKCWELTPDGFIQHACTGLVMGISFASKRRGAHVVTWSKDDQWDKKWQWKDGYIVNAHEDLAMGVCFASDKPGARVVTWSRDMQKPRGHAQWEFVPKLVPVAGF